MAPHPQRPGLRSRLGRCSCPALSLAASMNVALYAGIAGGLAAAFIVLGIVIYCCCCRGKDEAEDTKP